MALTGIPVIGKSMIAYYDADGDIAVPVWVAIGKAAGTAVEFDRDVAEVKERDEDDTTVLLGHINRTMTLEMARRPDNAIYDIIEAAAENGTKIGMAFYTGAIATQGHRGWAGEVYITASSDPQGHTDVIRTYTVRPCAAWITAPTFAETA